MMSYSRNPKSQKTKDENLRARNDLLKRRSQSWSAAQEPILSEENL